jgi:alkylation response protein AidB-like acyl-CoA dehydrogenase
LGGQGWSEAAVVRGYLKLSAACLTTTFVITQRSGAMSRIAASENEWVRGELLPNLLSGKSFATVGISHLTTSRQHLSQPVMRVTEKGNGFVLDGYSPWVTGGEKANHIVIGQLFFKISALAFACDLTRVVTFSAPVPQTSELGYPAAETFHGFAHREPRPPALRRSP